VKTLRLSAALAALTLTASTTRAAVIDLSNALGQSGGYTSQAYYQSMLGGQPMTAAQQAYANQEDRLRLLGFLSELGGDIPLGQIFYHMAYGITPPPSALDLASGGSDLRPPSITPSGLVTGASDVGYAGAGLTLTTPVNTGVGPATAVPEGSTWVNGDRVRGGWIHGLAWVAQDCGARCIGERQRAARKLPLVASIPRRSVQKVWARQLTEQVMLCHAC
jgi:hypothetical protein